MIQTLDPKFVPPLQMDMNPIGSNVPGGNGTGDSCVIPLASVVEQPMSAPVPLEIETPLTTAAGKTISSSRTLDEIFDLVCSGGGSLPPPRPPFKPAPIVIKTEASATITSSANDDAKHFCSLCNKMFSAERYFKQHYNSVHAHSGPKKFKCMLCQRSFYTEKALQKHIDHEVRVNFINR